MSKLTDSIQCGLRRTFKFNNAGKWNSQCIPDSTDEFN